MYCVEDYVTKALARQPMLGEYNMFIAAPYRQTKLDYLNRCISDAFDTTGWPEKTV